MSSELGTLLDGPKIRHGWLPEGIAAGELKMRLLTSLVLCLWVVVATADRWEDAFSAAERGDEAAALQIIRPLAEQGDASAQFLLGLAYKQGQAGMTRDYTEARRWYRLAAEQGHATAQNRLGVIYREGQGVPQDYVEARKWFRLAAEQGEPDAQNNLGLTYSEGQGVPQDYVEARKWFRLAAEQGDATAQFNLGLVYSQGW
ncbi:MAG: tetratricopeptide repeat protein, partial [Pseudomonadales bacterium]